MSYFPEDIPFMSEEERKANGIKTAKEIETQKMQLSKEDATFDCVSRQQVIDRIEWWFEILKQNPDILIDAIKTLSSAHPEQQWIPCSERLPEVGTYVLISKKALNFRSNLPNVCTAHRSCDPRSGKEEWNDMLFGKLDDGDVLAWMPLPEGYRGEQNE